MNKRRIAALALGMLMLLSGGCSLVDVDEEKAAELEKSKTIIEYNDNLITKDKVSMKMNKYLTAQGMAIADLEDGDDEEIWARFKNDVVSEMVVDLIALEKAAELGLDQLTDEEITALDEAYQTSLASIESRVGTSVAADIVSNDKLNYDTEFKRQLDEYFYLQGYSVETYRQDLEKEFIVDKVKAHFTKDVIVKEEDVRSYYDNNVKQQKGNIEISPSMVEQQMSFGSTVLYYPEGYMKVRHLLIGFDSATRGAAAIAYTNGDMDEYNRLIDEALPAIQPKIDEVLAKMEAGDDFTALIDEYNEDINVAVEPYRSEGFVEGPYSTNVDKEYIQAISTLTEPGQHTVFTNMYGCYIIRCEKLLEGAVPYEDVKDSFTASLLSQKRDLEWSTVSQGWVDEAKASGTLKLHTDRF
jgi:parvulin-like peptidyl-prolyl isomerase